MLKLWQHCLRIVYVADLASRAAASHRRVERSLRPLLSSLKYPWLRKAVAWKVCGLCVEITIDMQGLPALHDLRKLR